MDTKSLKKCLITWGWQFCGHVDKLSDLDSFDGTFLHLEKVGQEMADRGSFDGILKQKLQPKFNTTVITLSPTINEMAIAPTRNNLLL